MTIGPNHPQPIRPNKARVESASVEPLDRCQVGPAGPRELTSWPQVLDLVDSYAGLVLLVGYGSQRQYGDLPAARAELDSIADGLDQRVGAGHWLLVFGGDPYKEQKPDVAHLVRHLQQQRGVNTLAIQLDKVKAAGGVDESLDFVHYLPTSKDPHSGKTLWGGVRDGQPVGNTAAYLSPDFRQRLTAVVGIGGGEIAQQELSYAQSQGVEVLFRPAQALHPESG